jgi:hypothetical protein
LAARINKIVPMKNDDEKGQNDKARKDEDHGRACLGNKCIKVLLTDEG